MNYQEKLVTEQSWRIRDYDQLKAEAKILESFEVPIVLNQTHFSDGALCIVVDSGNWVAVHGAEVSLDLSMPFPNPLDFDRAEPPDKWSPEAKEAYEETMQVVPPWLRALTVGGEIFDALGFLQRHYAPGQERKGVIRYVGFEGLRSVSASIWVFDDEDSVCSSLSDLEEIAFEQLIAKKQTT